MQSMRGGRPSATRVGPTLDRHVDSESVDPGVSRNCYHAIQTVGDTSSGLHQHVYSVGAGHSVLLISGMHHHAASMREEPDLPGSLCVR